MLTGPSRYDRFLLRDSRTYSFRLVHLLNERPITNLTNVGFVDLTDTGRQTSSVPVPGASPGGLTKGLPQNPARGNTRPCGMLTVYSLSLVRRVYEETR